MGNRRSKKDALKEQLKNKTIDSATFVEKMKEAKDAQKLLGTGRFPNLSALPWYEKTALGTGATMFGSDIMRMGEKKDDEYDVSSWNDPYPIDPWLGDWSGVYSADGGIINAYDRGGPVDMPYDPEQEGYGMVFK